ncbi:MAG: hypothetical protein M0Z81_07690 [Deltaproteobacteria bacterium]|jgi:hypothetical protein|nr:hypothetical protein [Deltaproteobacteria bacterium]
MLSFVKRPSTYRVINPGISVSVVRTPNKNKKNNAIDVANDAEKIIKESFDIGFSIVFIHIYKDKSIKDGIVIAIKM